jgi:hypothetical protein
MIISLWNLLQYDSCARWAIQAQRAEPLVLTCCILQQNGDLFYFRFCSRNALLWTDFSCFPRLIKVLEIKWTRWSEILNLLVLLAAKYSAELNKYILLVWVICEKYRFRGRSNIQAAQEIWLSSKPVFFANNPH